jgi:hypothetical protein
MRRRRGRTIGAVLIAVFLLIASGYALFDDRSLRTMGSPVLKADVSRQVSQSERSLSVGARVFAVDGTAIGAVAGISRGDDGHVERIRVRTASLPALGARTVVIRDTAFSVKGTVVRLNLSVAEVKALPGIMTTDGAAG